MVPESGQNAPSREVLCNGLCNEFCEAGRTRESVQKLKRSIKPTNQEDKMKGTSTVAVDVDQWKRLCEYAQKVGKTAEEALQEALGDFLASCKEARRRTK
jgi:macrodomain Ter protein organizer (MatP/YcbG family)